MTWLHHQVMEVVVSLTRFAYLAVRISESVLFEASKSSGTVTVAM